MAHITYTKLGIKPIEDIRTFVLENNAEIEVRQYLPFQEKLAALTDIINSSSDDNAPGTSGTTSTSGWRASTRCWTSATRRGPA